jgi:hypothetical protein
MAEHWQIFASLAALVAAWSLVILGVMRKIMSQCTEDLDRKIAALSDISRDLQRIERAFMELRPTCPSSTCGARTTSAPRWSSPPRWTG